MTWELINAEHRAAASHGTFRIPARTIRESLRVGDLAKLVFADVQGRGPATGERMWVEIELVEDGRYRGRLRNTPALIQNLDESDPIEFGPEHVSDWANEESVG